MSIDTPFIVLKFGGTSVSSKQSWQYIHQIINEKKEQGYRVCVVHSALAGISDLLEELVEAETQKQATAVIQTIKEKHQRLAQALDLDVEPLLGEHFDLLEQLSHTLTAGKEANYKVEAHILAQGELMATKLGAAYLSDQNLGVSWRDARTFMKSSEQKNVPQKRTFLNAKSTFGPDMELQSTFQSLEPVVLTQGFIASNAAGDTVLLGRGGSDVSATYLAAKLNAERVEIWSDVPGMFSTNPHEVQSARLLTNLTYREAQEIATNGAPVLHPKSILPAQEYHIPIHLRCTTQPDMEGTVISSSNDEEGGSVKTIALRENIMLVSMESVLMWQKVGFLAKVFDVFKSFGLSVDLISTSESNITASLDPVTNSHFNEVREPFIKALQKHCNVEIIEQVSAVSLLGRHIRTILPQLSDFFEVFQEHKIYMVDQAVNDLNFTFVVDADQAPKLINELHEKLITKPLNRKVLGPSWNELVEGKASQYDDQQRWWKNKRDQLLDIAKEKGSAYVYSGNELQRNVEVVQQLNAISSTFYAMKANANPQILQLFYRLGLGFECVSIGEVKRIFELFPDIEPKRILFTPNFAPRREYKEALELEINVTLDNIFPLQQWPQLFEGEELFLRIDPGYGQGHHRHVKTGGDHSKFGIPRSKVEAVKTIINQTGIKIKGLHAHVGSGIKNESMWKDTGEILHQVAEELGGVDILDLGGGFGIKEFDMQSKLDLTEVDRHITEFKNDHPDYELWIEPGRFLTATAGVLITTVTQLKEKGKVHYVGVETGMNSFIRPALYGARHPIVNLSQLHEPAHYAANIVGPICESGDKLGIDRRLPKTSEGDIMLVANTGAYGRTMSSTYNLRQPAEEVFID